MKKYNDICGKIVDIPSEDKMNLEIDPRSKTTADGSFNYIAKGEEVQVKGTKRMLKNKSKTARWI
jgi:hypothetical protein|tara:strand:+ start:348 stop:542 length:195 start_codon:yes stop_codon:yes gene_type:complete